MKPALKELIRIYEPGDLDWMGDIKSKRNHFTYHHILEKRNGGQATVDNGAILTQNSHHLLNNFDLYIPEYYEAINYEFRLLNDTKMPPTKEYYERMALLIFLAETELNAKLYCEYISPEEREAYQRVLYENGHYGDNML